MRTILAFFCIGIFMFSCSPEPNGNEKNGIEAELTGLPPEEELYDLELIFDEDSGIIPLSQKSECKSDKNSFACQDLTKPIKDAVIDRIYKIDTSIHVNPNLIRVYFEVAVNLNELTFEQKEVILSNLTTLKAKVNLNNFDIQLSRPIMQSEEYLEHAQKPRMQEQLRYDSIAKSSLLIQLVGGGVASPSSKDNIVWIIDTGIDNSHQDLTSIIDSLSVDYVNDGGPFVDSLGHGTFIAGLVGGKASSDPTYAIGYGINGMVPEASMVSLKVFKSNSKGKYKAKSQDIVSALDHIAQKSHPGDIVNISWGMLFDPGEDCSSKKYEDIINKIKAIADTGVYFVMSAGNLSSESLMNFPGCLSYPNVYTIGSVEVDLPANSFYYSSFSNYGVPSIDYLTPGEDLFTTAPGGKYAQVSGTSFSAAIFSGILYNGGEIDTLRMIRRGADATGANPEYPIAKTR